MTFEPHAQARQNVDDQTIGEPMFWVRLCGNNLYEGPFHHRSAEGLALRQAKPDEWHPLFCHAPPKTKPTSSIGGSVLASSDESILKPMPGKHGTFQVLPLPDLDKYALEFVSTAGRFRPTLVMHPNGYSCHGLAKRLLSAWDGNSTVDHAMEQFDYILDCGGIGTLRKTVEYIAKGLPSANNEKQGPANA